MKNFLGKQRAVKNGRDSVISYQENQASITVEIKRPDLRYLNELTRITCGADLLQTKFFPNAKEITESFGAYNAVRKHLQNDYSFTDKTVTCYVIGDGCKPRTGAVFAFRTAWKVLSIDPKCSLPDGEHPQIDRLWTIKARIEDLQFKHHPQSKVLVVCVHSHALLSNVLGAICMDDFTIVNIPCCVPSDLTEEPNIIYQDWGITSPERTVEIYKFKDE